MPRDLAKAKLVAPRLEGASWTHFANDPRHAADRSSHHIVERRLAVIKELQWSLLSCLNFHSECIG
jgi:hypothetical protein